MPQEATAVLGAGPPALRFRNAGWRWFDDAGGAWAIRAVDWEVPAGQVAAILGPNGGGKSTLLRMAAGYLFPSEGDVEVLGGRLGRIDVHALRQRLGIVDPGSPWPFAPHMTAAAVIGTGFRGRLTDDFAPMSPAEAETAARLAGEVGVEHRLRARFATLSSGESRRVLLARALAGQPELLLLDEPAAGLDLPGREALLAALVRLKRQRPGLTVVLVTHHLEELLPGTSAVLLAARGRATAAGPAEAVLTSATLGEAFGCPVEVEKRHGRWWWRVPAAAWS